MSSYEVLEAFASLRRELALKWSSATKSMDFGHKQLVFLYRLSLSSATMGELAEFAMTDKASITRSVALLEKAGLVRRIADKHDRRVVHIELTAKGRTESKKAVAARDSIGKTIHASLSAAERKQFVALVNKIVQHSKNV